MDERLHGKDDVTAGELLTGASEHGKGTIDDMFDESRVDGAEQDYSSEESDDGTAKKEKPLANSKGIVAKSIYDD